MATLIKNGLVYDGTGAPPKKTDVLLQRTRVARLGDFGRREAEKVLDATGAIVMPGVVEMDFEPEAEDEIFDEEAGRYLLRRGITTVIDGTDGTSLAPLLLPLRHASHAWRTLREFRETLSGRRPALNFGTLVGYAGLRRAFTARRRRDLDPRELDQLLAVIRLGLKEGARGIGLGDVEELRLPDWEILALAKEAARAGRLLTLHLGDAGDLNETLARVLAIAKKSGANIEFTHFEPRSASAAAFKAALGTIEKQAARVHVGLDVFPLPYARFDISSFLPHWFRSAAPADTLADLRAAHAKDRLLEHFKKLPLGDLRIAEVPRHLKFLKGKRVGDLAADWGTRPERAFLRLALITDLRCCLTDPGVDREVLCDVIANSRTALTLSFHEVEEGDFKEIFASAADNGKISTEQTIAKLTGMPAKKLSLDRRGIIAPDHFADIAVLRDEKVSSVFVNGALVLEDGIFTAQRSGTVL